MERFVLMSLDYTEEDQKNDGQNNRMINGRADILTDGQADRLMDGQICENKNEKNTSEKAGEREDQARVMVVSFLVRDGKGRTNDRKRL